MLSVYSENLITQMLLDICCAESSKKLKTEYAGATDEELTEDINAFADLLLL